MSRPLLVDPARFQAEVLTQQFKPYGWNSKGPFQFDCSGLVTWGLLEAGGPDLRATHNSQLLFDKLQQISSWQKGMTLLSFYGDGPDAVEHVMVVFDDGRAFGTHRGGRRVVTLADAIRERAYITFQPSPSYRRDLLGFRELRYREHAPTPGAPHAG